MIEILDDNIFDLKYWLIKHESDIAYEVNDFGDLKWIFHNVVGRYPETDKNTADT